MLIAEQVTRAHEGGDQMLTACGLALILQGRTLCSGPYPNSRAFVVPVWSYLAGWGASYPYRKGWAVLAVGHGLDLPDCQVSEARCKAGA